jgi:hypothetical protein
MAETRKINLLDIYLSSFISLHGIEPKLEAKGGKVVFTFPATDRIYGLMNLFNQNSEVKVADFVTSVKTLRGKMLTAKDNVNGNGKGVGNDRYTLDPLR